MTSPVVRRLLAALTTLMLATAACTDATDEFASAKSNTRGEPAGGEVRESPNQDSGGELDWGRCTEELASLAGLECATLSVPIDRQAKESEPIDLALARLPSSGDPAERIGSLLFNPGGPGGSGIEFLAGAAPMVPEELRTRFDLVSWDPRGVAASTPVRCLTDERKEAQIEGDLSPDEQTEWDRAVEDQHEFLEGCEQENPELIEHMSTADVAGDLDEIREALGDEKLNYVGFSYGTAIGATYATLFPQNVRAMVLDGSVSPSASDLEQTTAQAEGFERTYLSFVATCDADPECALAGGTAAAIDTIRSDLDADPLVVDTDSGERELTRDLFDIGLATGLYDTSVWGPLARAIDDLQGSGGEVILSLTDRQLGRNPDGTWDNSADAQMMVSCADAEDRPTIDEAIAQTEIVANAAPTFGEALKTSPLSCIDWPMAANPVPEWSAQGAPPILVVGTVGDPATPYEWSEQMVEVLEGSVLLTYEGDGHTAFMRGGPCIDDAVVEYLVDLELPAPGTSCPATKASDGDGLDDLRQQLVDELTAAGLPDSVAECIAERLEADLGASGLEDLLLGGDAEELTQKMTEITLACMDDG